MRIIYYLAAICFLAACSKDAKDYKMKELEQDLYAKDRIERELTVDERLYLLAAQQRFAADNMETELANMTVGEVIENEKRHGNPDAVEQLKDTRSKDLEFELVNYTAESKKDAGFIQWEIEIRNNGTKAIAGVTVTLTIKGSNGEIMRSDRILCTGRIEPGNISSCTSRVFDFNPADGSKDLVVSKTGLDVLKSMAEFRVDAISFSSQ